MIQVKSIIICDVCTFERVISETLNIDIVRQVAETFGWKRVQLKDFRDVCPLCWKAWEKACEIHGGK